MLQVKVETVKDDLDTLTKSLLSLVKYDVLVGVPEDKAAREGGEINNATLAYYHDKGAPEANIPARPFMVPGMKRVRQKTIERFHRAGLKALDADEAGMKAELERAGIEAASAIKKVIQEGIPPPLKLESVRGRMYKNKRKSLVAGEQEYISLAKGGATPQQLMESGTVIPLLDTGKLVASISSELRLRGGRRPR